LDTSFLHEEVEFTTEPSGNIRSNVQKLVEFTAAAEKKCGSYRPVAVVESEENWLRN